VICDSSYSSPDWSFVICDLSFVNHKSQMKRSMRELMKLSHRNHTKFDHRHQAQCNRQPSKESNHGCVSGISEQGARTAIGDEWRIDSPAMGDSHGMSSGGFSIVMITTVASAGAAIIVIIVVFVLRWRHGASLSSVSWPGHEEAMTEAVEPEIHQTMETFMDPETTMRYSILIEHGVFDRKFIVGNILSGFYSRNIVCLQVNTFSQYMFREIRSILRDL
jgi:hypothetical protein